MEEQPLIFVLMRPGKLEFRVLVADGPRPVTQVCKAWEKASKDGMKRFAPMSRW